MNVSGEPLLRPGLLLRALKADPAQAREILADRLYGYGRQAMAAAMRRLPPGRILTPAYICDTAVQGLHAAGRVPEYYPIGDDLAPDWDHLDSLSLHGRAGMILVHYFGIGRDVERAVAFCRERDLLLIEDCAHAFLSEHRGRPLGGFGDFAVFSYRKTLPLWNGAGLQAAGEGSRPAGDIASQHGRGGRGRPALDIGRFVIRSSLKWLVFRSGAEGIRSRLASTLSDEPASPSIGPEAMDGMSLRILAAERNRLPRIRDIRRRNYLFLARELLNLPHIRPLTPDLPDGVCPWAFALATPRRNELLEVLLFEGIGAWMWPDLPGSASVEQHPEAHALAESTLLLPVHQDLAMSHMRHTADTVVAWAVAS